MPTSLFKSNLLLSTSNKSYIQLLKGNLQGGLLSLSSQLSTLPRRAEFASRPGVARWKKYFPIISTTLSSSDKTGSPCPKSKAVVYTIPIPVCETPVSPPSVWSASSPCIEQVELSGSEPAARSFYPGEELVASAELPDGVGGADRISRESSSWFVAHATCPGIALQQLLYLSTL